MPSKPRSNRASSRSPPKWAGRGFSHTQNDNAIPVPFFIVLTFWLVVIFAASACWPNRAQRDRLNSVFAISVSSALFLIVDLSHPFGGLMQISNNHLRAVLPKIE